MRAALRSRGAARRFFIPPRGPSAVSWGAHGRESARFVSAVAYVKTRNTLVDGTWAKVDNTPILAPRRRFLNIYHLTIKPTCDGLKTCQPNCEGLVLIKSDASCTHNRGEKCSFSYGFGVQERSKRAQEPLGDFFRFQELPRALQEALKRPPDPSRAPKEAPNRQSV